MSLRHLHLGCGRHIIPGFINVDKSLSTNSDYVDDARYLNSLQSMDFDLIYASHLLQMFDVKDIRVALKNWYNLLAPGGVLRLSVPNFRKIVHAYLERHMSFESCRELLLGSPSETFKTLFDESCLIQFLRDTGFKDIQQWEWTKTDHSFVDDMSQNIYSLNIEGIKPL